MALTPAEKQRRYRERAAETSEREMAAEIERISRRFLDEAEARIDAAKFNPAPVLAEIDRLHGLRKLSTDGAGSLRKLLGA